MPRWIMPLALAGVTLAYTTATEDRFHALRWSLLALAATLGLSLLLLTRGGSLAASLSLSHAHLPLGLAAGSTLFSLLSLGPAANLAEAFWQTSQTAAWSAWFLLVLAAGALHPPLWRSLRRTAVALALLGAAFAAGEYWGLWASEAGSPMRPGALHGNRNLAASFQVLLAPWVLWALVEERGPHRYLAAAGWVGFGYVLAITQSRAAWLGAAVMGLAALLLAASRGRSALPELKLRLRVMLFAVLPIALAFAFHGLARPSGEHRGGGLERLATLADPAFAGNARRLALWGKTLELIAGHPLLGVGAGNRKVALPSTGPDGLPGPDRESVEVRPYNDWLWAAAETGIPGDLCWLGILIAALAAGRRAFRRQAHPALGYPVLILTAGLAGFAVVCALDFPRERPEHMAWYAVSLAALINLASAGRPPAREATAGGLAPAFLLALALVAAGGSAWFACARLRNEMHIHAGMEME